MKLIFPRFVIWLLLILSVIQPLSAQRPGESLSVADYILRYRDLALQKSAVYRIPASVILGQGILESANGNSELARMANNHFGVKCHKDWKGETYIKDDDKAGECFRKYKSVGESYEDHGIFLSTRDRYASLFTLDPADYKAWAYGLKQAGYATNPDYARLLIKVIEENRLYEIDKGNLTDPVALPPPQSGQGKKPSGNAGFDPITAGGPPREVWENNSVKFIYARQGDNVEKVSEALGLMTWQIRRFNDLEGDRELVHGEIIYIKTKKRKAQVDVHKVVEGDDLWRISQRYALKMKVLCRRNQLEPGARLKPGITIFLNKAEAKSP